MSSESNQVGIDLRKVESELASFPWARICKTDSRKFGDDLLLTSENIRGNREGSKIAPQSVASLYGQNVKYRKVGLL